MRDTNGTQENQKAAKVKRKPEQESVLRPTFAAARQGIDGTLWDRDQQGSGLLQRQCACGTHTIGGRECDACRKKREANSLQRTFIGVEARNTVLNDSPESDILPVSAQINNHEREANRVANQVMTITQPKIHRQTEEGEEIKARPLAEDISLLGQKQDQAETGRPKEFPGQTPKNTIHRQPVKTKKSAEASPTNFENLKNAYQDRDTMLDEVKFPKWITDSIMSSDGGSCAVRMSNAYNRAGDSLLKATKTRKFRDLSKKNFYILGADEFARVVGMKFKKYRIKDLESIKGKTGIIYFENHHIDLYDKDHMVGNGTATYPDKIMYFKELE